MKSTSSLLIAFGLASSAAFAQSQSQPLAPSAATPGAQTQHDSPASGASGLPAGPGTQGGAQARPQSPGAQLGAPAGAAPAASSSTFGSGASGADSSLSGGSGSLGTQSGAQSGMPPHPGSGSSGTHPATGSGMPDAPLPPAGAQPPSRPSSGAGLAGASPLARLEPKTENGITYLCGGVGLEEASYMKQQAGKHDLALTFAAKDGEYLANVNVAIRDARGSPVLETNCDGPMMLVDLPKGGTYRIHAETAGYALDRTVSVSRGKVASAVLTWPASAARIGETGDTASGSSGGGSASGSGQGSGGGERRW